ncbi:hypothetical protein [Specibacter cremeus]|uniref:hypothetical protein n=1 Tax=Specibacter cremeus TaxID=1629051 RepID=UPI000F796D15|nr:hypothetical protein [Specibacter cremeus]
MIGFLAVPVVAAFQFWVLNTGSALLITAAVVGMRIAQSAAFDPVSSILAEAFAPAVRWHYWWSFRPQGRSWQP